MFLYVLKIKVTNRPASTYVQQISTAGLLWILPLDRMGMSQVFLHPIMSLGVNLKIFIEAQWVKDAQICDCNFNFAKSNKEYRGILGISVIGNLYFSLLILLTNHRHRQSRLMWDDCVDSNYG